MLYPAPHPRRRASGRRRLLSPPTVSNRAMRRSFLTTAVGVLVAGLLAPSVAEACFAAARIAATLRRRRPYSRRTVAGEEPDPAAGGGVKTIRLSDIRPIRGVAPRALELQGSSCDLELKVGVRYLIEPHEWAPGKFGVSQCGVTRPAERATGFRDWLAAALPEQRPRVWGTVTMPTVDHRSYLDRGGGLAVAGAVVLMDGAVQRTTTTSSSGEFSFAAVPDGRYSVRVELPASRLDVTAPEPATVELGAAQMRAAVDPSPGPQPASSASSSTRTAHPCRSHNSISSPRPTTRCAAISANCSPGPTIRALRVHGRAAGGLSGRCRCAASRGVSALRADARVGRWPTRHPRRGRVDRHRGAYRRAASRAGGGAGPAHRAARSEGRRESRSSSPRQMPVRPADGG